MMMIAVCDEQQSYNPTSATQKPWEENNYAKQPSARIMCAYGIFTNGILRTSRDTGVHKGSLL